MAREPVPTSLVVVRLGHRFLLVQERKHGQRWYLPAGRLEPGETFEAAALRETLEESGLSVILEGVLRIERSLLPDGAARLRVFFLARPRDDTPPKSVPDQESLGAAWVSLEEIRGLSLRGTEPTEIFSYVADGGPVYPLGVLTMEGAPWRPSRT